MTTLIKILTGQLKPDKGSAELMKHDTVSLSGRDKKEIGIMMDQFGVYERLSCTDNLRIYADIYGVSHDRILQTLDKTMPPGVILGGILLVKLWMGLYIN